MTELVGGPARPARSPSSSARSRAPAPPRRPRPSTARSRPARHRARPTGRASSSTSSARTARRAPRRGAASTSRPARRRRCTCRRAGPTPTARRRGARASTRRQHRPDARADGQRACARRRLSKVPPGSPLYADAQAGALNFTLVLGAALRARVIKWSGVWSGPSGMAARPPLLSGGTACTTAGAATSAASDAAERLRQLLAVRRAAPRAGGRSLRDCRVRAALRGGRSGGGVPRREVPVETGRRSRFAAWATRAEPAPSRAPRLGDPPAGPSRPARARARRRLSSRAA